jgi:hypothetical protein
MSEHAIRRIEFHVLPEQSGDMLKRFPAPWWVDSVPGGYVIRDAKGNSIAYVYGQAAKLKVSMTLGEAQVIAETISDLPNLLATIDKSITLPASRRLTSGKLARRRFRKNSAVGSPPSSS